MPRTSEIIAGIALGAFICLAASLALIAEPADAGYGVASKPQVHSNAAAKADRLATARPGPREALEVAEIRRIGDDFILLDAKGRVVYRSDRTQRTTTVAKDVKVPLLTGYGVAVGAADTSARHD